MKNIDLPAKGAKKVKKNSSEDEDYDILDEYRQILVMFSGATRRLSILSHWLKINTPGLEQSFKTVLSMRGCRSKIRP